MICSYDENYLDDAQKLMGWMLHHAVYTFQQNIQDFYNRFLESSFSKGIEHGGSWIIGGMSGCEVAYQILKDTCTSVDELERQLEKAYCSINRSPEYWAGWAIAYYQWIKNYTFHKINENVQVEAIIEMFPKYHEADITLFVTDLDAQIGKANQMNRLKYYRLRMQMSQSELAIRTGIPLRTIQQYEQGQKKLAYAKAEYVINLSKALYCEVAELVT